MGKMQNINMDYRPKTYWPELLSQKQLISKIKGKVRQEIARDILKNEETPELTADLARESLSIEEKKAWGAIHPDFMGGEYLPDIEENEVEIARVSLASTTSDQISIRAKKNGDTIDYRIVGEYEDTGLHYRLAFNQSKKPLTLSELVKLIDNSNIPDDIYPYGLIIGGWEASYDGGRDIEAAINFASVTSSFYPELQDYYTQRAQEWTEEKKRERMEVCPDCGQLYDEYEVHECEEGNARIEKEMLERQKRENEENKIVAPFLNQIEEILKSWRILHPGGSGAGGFVQAAANSRTRAVERFIRDYIVQNNIMPTGKHTIKWQFMSPEQRTFDINFDTIVSEAAQRIRETEELKKNN